MEARHTAAKITSRAVGHFHQIILSTAGQVAEEYETNREITGIARGGEVGGRCTGMNHTQTSPRSSLCPQRPERIVPLYRWCISKIKRKDRRLYRRILLLSGQQRTRIESSPHTDDLTENKRAIDPRSILEIRTNSIFFSIMKHFEAYMQSYDFDTRSRRSRYHTAVEGDVFF